MTVRDIAGPNLCPGGVESAVTMEDEARINEPRLDFSRREQLQCERVHGVDLPGHFYFRCLAVNKRKLVMEITNCSWTPRRSKAHMGTFQICAQH